MTILSRLGSRSTASKDLKCSIRLLDDSETLDCEFNKNENGQYLLNYVCDYLNIIEKDYFGIRYMDSHKQRYWLDLNKPILKQLKGVFPLTVSFRVKYYPTDPSILAEEITRYQLFLQLRRDLLHGRLYCSQTDAAILGAYIVQSELGDYDPDEHKDGYVSEFKLMLKQSAKLEEKIAQIHRSLKGQVPSVAETHFLNKASSLDTYGFDPYSVKDTKNGQVYIGVTHQGVLVYQANRKQHHIEWKDLEKVDYTGRDFILHISAEHSSLLQVGQSSESPQTTLNGPHSSEDGVDKASKNKQQDKDKKRILLRCPSASFCKHLWKYTLDQRAFFTSRSSAEVKPQTSKRRFLVRGSTFRYSGRVFSEIKAQEPPRREPPSFMRYHLPKQVGDRKYATLPARLRHEDADAQRLVQNGTAVPVGESEGPQKTILTVDTTSGLESQDQLASVSPNETTVSYESEQMDLSPGNRNSTVIDHSLSDAEKDAEKSAAATADSAVNEGDISIPIRHLSATAPVITSMDPAGNIEEIYKPSKANSASYNNASNGSAHSSSPCPAVNGTGKHVSASTTEKPSAFVPNGQVESQSDEGSSGSILLAVSKFFLTTLFFLLFLAAVVVVVMEIQDADLNQYLDQYPVFVKFREEYYNPAREYSLQQWQKLSEQVAAATSSAPIGGKYDSN